MYRNTAQVNFETSLVDNSTDRQPLLSFHEQSINVMNLMVSGEWDRESRAEREDEAGKGSTFGAIFILMNTILGASIVVLPCSFGQIGIVTAIIMELFVAIVAYIGHMVLVDAIERYNGTNYQDLVGKICGPKVQILSQILLCTYFFSLSSSTHITMGDQAVRICTFIDGASDSNTVHWYCHRDFLIPLGSMTLIFPLIWFRNINSFSYASVFSVMAVFYIVVAVVADYYHLNPVITDEIWMPDVGILPIMQYLPVFALGFQCHMTSVPLYHELHNRSVARYSFIIIVSSLLVLTCYLVTGIFGLMTFGVTVDPDVLLSYAPDDKMVTVARGAIAVSVIASYPIFTFLGRGALEDTMLQIAGIFNREIEQNNECRRVITILVWHFLALGIAMLTHSLGKVLAVIGSIASLFMLFFPGYMMWVEGRVGNWGYRVTSIIFMSLGVFTFVWTICYNVYVIASG